jgi:alpha-galactosidase
LYALARIFPFLPTTVHRNYYHCNIDENTIKALADAMVANGMKDAGYEYINVRTRVSLCRCIA